MSTPPDTTPPIPYHLMSEETNEDIAKKIKAVENVITVKINETQDEKRQLSICIYNLMMYCFNSSPPFIALLRSLN